MAARDKVPPEPQLAAAPGQRGELGSPIGEHHRKPRQAGARAGEALRRRLGVRFRVKGDLGNAVSPLLEGRADVT